MSVKSEQMKEDYEYSKHQHDMQRMDIFDSAEKILRAMERNHIDD